MKRTIALVGALLVGASLSAEAKDLYVNNSGSPACSDSTSYAANDSAHPWCTIGRAAWGSLDPNGHNAAEAAQAGDTIRIAAGTTPRSDREPPAGVARGGPLP